MRCVSFRTYTGFRGKQMNQRFAGLRSLVETDHANICEIVAVKNGETVYEDTWHGFAPTDALNVMSVTKSVVSLLIGIAVDRGMIDGVEQNVLDFFPEYVVRRGERTIRQVRIRHLLTMTAPYKYRSEPWAKICASPDWTRAALDILGGRNGITGEFKYSTLGVQILSGILTNASGMPVVEFANRCLFEPLGIPRHRNASVHDREEQYGFLMSKAPQGDVWMADPKGANTAGWGVCLSARDMARIGQMCLQNGSFEGRRIVSSEWVGAMTEPRIACGQRFGNMSYGYLWWIVDGESPTYAAVGDGGNVIYANPDADVVVAITATFKPRVFDRIQFIQEHVEPLLMGAGND